MLMTGMVAGNWSKVVGQNAPPQHSWQEVIPDFDLIHRFVMTPASVSCVSSVDEKNWSDSSFFIFHSSFILTVP